MSSFNPKVDVYLSKSRDFAIPILEFLRETVHTACPDVEEAIKWSFPVFVYHNNNLCSMAAFKRHCSFGFWLAAEMKDTAGIFAEVSDKSMGHLGKITKFSELPSRETLISYIQEAMELIDRGVKIKRELPKTKTDIIIPDYFTKALATNKNAKVYFENFSYSHKKEYVQWITEAKTEETRDRRMAKALEMIAEGKSQNWKYQKATKK